MARTLKSDKMLFLATLLLVGVSVVMVYSASAVQALAKYRDASTFFLYKQLAWAVHRACTLMLVVMRVDYHEYRRPVVIWSLLGVTVVLLVAVLLLRAAQRHAALDHVRVALAAAVGAREAGGDPVHGRAARAPDAPRERARLRARCRSRVVTLGSPA